MHDTQPTHLLARVSLVLLIGLAAARALHGSASPAQSAAEPPIAVRITSPLGRTGATGLVRIVAQVNGSGPATKSVRFFVDDVLLGEVHDGPPWALEWSDENPFEPRQISVEASDALGHTARDAVFLKPFEVAEESKVSAVLLETSVQDRFGRYVTGIDAAAFSVAEDGVPQHLDLVRSETLPATYTLLVDSSQSMARRIDFVRDAAGTLAGALRAKDRIIIAPFSRTLTSVTGPTDDQRTVTEAISAITSKGGTAILDSLQAAAGMVSGLEGRHAIVLITDGYDEHSTVSIEDALGAVQRAGASVYVVGIGGVAGISIKGERLLRRIASETGGKAFFPAREFELRPVHQQVASDVQMRYVLAYTPSNQKVDGAWRKVTVTASNPAWTIRTRPGYFAPKPSPIRPSLEFTMIDTEKRLLDVAADDLQVFEDGAEQVIEVFQEAVEPISIVFALDTSGSMKKVTEEIKAAARSFVGSLRPQDPLALILFGDKARFAHDLSTNRQWSFDAIDRYKAIGGTALYDGVNDALLRLRGIAGRRVVIVMTDGRDENNPGTGPGSVQTFAGVLERLKAVDATVFTIGLGTKLDRTVLERLASESGGEAAFPEDVSGLGPEFRRIVENLRRRYVLGYTSTNSAHDGGWRKVEIRSRRPGVRVVSRGGYFAPAR